MKLLEYGSMFSLQLWTCFFLSGVYAETHPHADEPSLPEGMEVVARLEQVPGNITVTGQGRILISLHQHFSPELRVVEVLPDGSLTPFPTESWNDPEQPASQRLDSVLGIQVDTEGIVWMLDNGMRSGVTPKLVGWNLEEDRLEDVIALPQPASRDDSFLNDLAVDRTHQTIYIADPTRGEHQALIVVDLNSGTARRILESHPGVSAEDVDLIIDQQPVRIRRPDGTTFRPRVGVNPIALNKENTWLYFGPMHGTAMYRIRTSDLTDATLPEAELAARVERFGNKPISDGSSVTGAGEVLVSDIGNNAIGLVNPNGSYRQLFQHDTLIRWPDAFSFGPGDWCYVVINQLHLGPVLNAGEDESQAPYLIVRFHLPQGGVTGR
jgi:sugar lactone lactonase YvrE